jgi:gliding motility-associated-like protein
VQFTNNSFGAATAEWTFGSFAVSNEYHSEYEFPVEEAQIIPVQLVVENQFGCRDTVVKNIIVQEEFSMYVPNAFSPDGDGLNDFFFIQGEDINRDEYVFQIFNRWGEMVWESTNPDEPWDGSDNGGDYYVEEGVYVWRIETRALSTAEKKEFMGHITVIR